MLNIAHCIPNSVNPLRLWGVAYAFSKPSPVSSPVVGVVGSALNLLTRSKRLLGTALEAEVAGETEQRLLGDSEFANKASEVRYRYVQR